MTIIAFSGHAGAGKDTACAAILYHFKRTRLASGILAEGMFRREAFADPIREACKAFFNWNDVNFAHGLKEQVDPYWNCSPRQLAQYMGTEIGRDILTEYLGLPRSLWIHNMSQRVDRNSPMHTIITDLRFQDEADWIQDNNGYIIHLTRPGFDGKIGIQNHRSEAGYTPKSKERYYELENSENVAKFKKLVIGTINSFNLGFSHD